MFVNPTGHIPDIFLLYHVLVPSSVHYKKENLLVENASLMACHAKSRLKYNRQLRSIQLRSSNFILIRFGLFQIIKAMSARDLDFSDQQWQLCIKVYVTETFHIPDRLMY